MIYALSWLGLLQLHRQSMDNAPILSEALRSVLGNNYRGDIPLGRQGVLRTDINSGEWLRPFRMRRDGVKVHRDLSYGDHGKRY